MTIDEKYMARAIQLAKNGRQNAVPNPMVGAVIVHDGKIIGEGYHVRCGEGHAEVNAVASVKNKELLKESTIYVSLEPCAHYGKTPPCAKLLIDNKIPRVVVGCVDPFAKVQGKGIQMLRDAGAEVVVGVLEEECKKLNERFMTFHKEGRPFITLKWAQSADGYIYSKDADKYLSNEHTLMLVHKLRAENQAILIGSNTAMTDNPTLTTRSWYGKNPTRVVIDRQNRLPHNLKIFDGSVPTIVYTLVKPSTEANNVEYVQLSEEGFIKAMLSDLHERNVQSLLVEGGRQLHELFISSNLWDIIRVEESEAMLGGGVEAPELPEHIAGKTDKTFGHCIITYRNNFKKL